MPESARAVALCAFMLLMALLCLPPAPKAEALRSADVAPLVEVAAVVALSAEDVHSGLEAAVTPYRTARSWLDGPRDLLALVGVKQGWTMFSGVDTHPARLIIEVNEDDWRTVHVTADPAHTWGHRMLNEPRMRATINHAASDKRRSKKRWRAFTDWLALRVLADHPDATAVRFSILRQHTPSPEQLRTSGWPDGERTRQRTVRR